MLRLPSGSSWATATGRRKTRSSTCPHAMPTAAPIAAAAPRSARRRPSRGATRRTAHRPCALYPLLRLRQGMSGRSTEFPHPLRRSPRTQLHPAQTTRNDFIIMVERLASPAAHELDALTDLWERSVRATHDFWLRRTSLFRRMVRQEALPAAEIYVIRDSGNGFAAFAGIGADRLEMLLRRALRARKRSGARTRGARRGPLRSATRGCERTERAGRGILRTNGFPRRLARRPGPVGSSLPHSPPRTLTNDGRPLGRPFRPFRIPADRQRPSRPLRPSPENPFNGFSLPIIEWPQAI